MEIEAIYKFISQRIAPGNEYVKIAFKKRSPVYGFFLKNQRDFNELKEKNFWRIVLKSDFEEYKKSKNPNLARLFSGKEFSSLTHYQETVDWHVPAIRNIKPQNPTGRVKEVAAKSNR